MSLCGCKVNASSEGELPPLFAAIGYGQREMANTLLSSSADVCQLYGDFSSTVLHYAIERKQPQMVRSHFNLTVCKYLFISA